MMPMCLFTQFAPSDQIVRSILSDRMDKINLDFSKRFDRVYVAKNRFSLTTRRLCATFISRNGKNRKNRKIYEFQKGRAG